MNWVEKQQDCNAVNALAQLLTEARGWVNRCVNVSGGILPLLG